MDARQLFESGKLGEALEALTQEVKANPTDLGRRTFLFELLCFQGDLDRAEKQLDVIARDDPERQGAAEAYRNMLTAERKRRRVFAEGLKPEFIQDPPDYVTRHIEALSRVREDSPAEAKALLDEAESARPEFRGEMDGTPFEDFRDCDDVLSCVLEFFIGPEYAWLPLEHVKEVELAEPTKPRDLLWATCRVEFTDGSQRRGYMPALYPTTHEAEEDQVLLGRKTDWNELPDGPTLGLGQRMFLGEEPKAMLEVRSLKFGG